MPRGSRRLPDECVRRLKRADLILHAGDFVSAEVHRELARLGPLEAVHGNMDDDELKRMLPARRVVEVGEARIGMVHEPSRISGFEDCDAVVFGHTHMPEHDEQDGFQVFNPGSPTERRRAPVHTMGIATVDGPRIAFELLVVG